MTRKQATGEGKRTMRQRKRNANGKQKKRLEKG